MKKLSHIYRQSFVHERQSLDKTITSVGKTKQEGQDKLAWARQMYDKGRQFQID